MGADRPLLGENTASNNWVVSGNYTENGRALLANDPHLQTNIPAVWQLQELVIGKQKVRGASLAGLPLISLGTNGHVAWGVTAPIEDNSDVWLEEISEDGLKYKVDGEWR